MDDLDFFNDLIDVLVLDFLDEDELVAGLMCDNEGGENRQEINRINIDFWRTLGDPTFKSHFRMNRSVFEKLVVAVGNHLDMKNRIVFIRTPLDVALMETLWILCTPDSFRSAAVTFGTSKGVIFFHYLYLIEALREMSSTYITWPGSAERDSIKTYVEEHYGYIGSVGFIDCTQIRVIAPAIQRQRYVNRHHDYAIMVQAVCDHTLLFRDVYVGEPGAVGDVRALERSPLYRNLYGGENIIDEDEHLLGDGIYPVSRKIIPPYLLNNQLPPRQRYHNFVLSRARASIERAFARLKGMFRRLKLLPCLRIHYAIDHIMACLVLHNFIILNGCEPFTCEEDRPLPCPEDWVMDNALIAEDHEHGIYKREYIAERLHPEDD